MHVGSGRWIIVDSCLDPDGTPGPLRYLESIGVDPVRDVALIVATHWHDDHIRGMARLVERCPAAQFCCSSALCREEFLTLVGALEGRHFSASGSGLRELHGVFSRLVEAGKNPTHALANRVVFRKETCTISSLSPGDEVFQRFLTSVRGLIPKQGGNKTRIRSLSPNEAALALWVDTGDFTLLLGADLEKSGWVAVVESPTRSTDPTRSTEKASAFKVPHHGSENADEPTVWQQMLESDPLAVLTPWRRGGHALPTAQDVVRILEATQNAYVTDNGLPRQNPRHRNSAVTRTLRESGSRFRRLTADNGSVRLRRHLGSQTQWTVETLGSACRLIDFAA